MHIGLEGQASVVTPTPALYQQVGAASHRGTCHMGEVGQTSGSKPVCLTLKVWGPGEPGLGFLMGRVLTGKAPRLWIPACLPARSPPASWARPVVSSEFSQRRWPPPRLSLGHTA